MNYLKKGLEKTNKGILKHKYLFMIILMVQFLFLITFSLNFFTYQVKIIESSQLIINAVDEANFESEDINDIPKIADMAGLLSSYQSIRDNIKDLILSSALIYLVMNGLIWVLSHNIFKNKLKLKESLKMIISFFLTSVAFIIIYSIIVYFFLLPRFLSLENLTSLLSNMGYLLFIVYYFMLVSYAFIDIKWRKCFNKFVNSSVKKFYLTIPLFFIILTLIAGTSYFTFRLINESNQNLAIFTGLLIVFMIVLTRIYWIATLKVINDEKSHN